MEEVIARGGMVKEEVRLAPLIVVPRRLPRLLPIASALHLPVLDLWTVFMRKAGWDPDDDGWEESIGSRKAPKSKCKSNGTWTMLELTSYSLPALAKAYRVVKAAAGR